MKEIAVAQEFHTTPITTYFDCSRIGSETEIKIILQMRARKATRGNNNIVYDLLPQKKRELQNRI